MITPRGKAMALLAANGILLGCTPGGVGSAVPTIEIPQALEDTSQPAEPRARRRVANCCKGMNACKGKGECKTDRHDCKGMNDCKALGGCKPGDCSGR